MEVNHPALTAKTGIRASRRWLEAQAAQAVLGLDYDDFKDTVPYDRQITVIAQYEANWRIEALQAHEREQERNRRSQRSRKKPRV